jgi:hypothetical protein
MSQYRERPISADDQSIIARLYRAFETAPDTPVVITGSHAVAALTGAVLAHNDIDTNVFGYNATSQPEQVLARLESIPELEELRVDGAGVVCRIDGRLTEIQLHDIAGTRPLPGTEQTAGVELALPNGQLVPTCVVEYGEAGRVRVKTPEYILSSWALRLSGILPYQKREPRATDMQHYRLLRDMQLPFDRVAATMRSHPQYVDGADPAAVLTMADGAVRGA